MVFRLAWILLLVGSTAGCRDRTADQLPGRWIGRPDTAASQAAREALRYHDSMARHDPISRGAGTGQPSGDRHGARSEAERSGALPPDDRSDWERYDVRILLEFTRTGQVTMSLADGSEARSGTWRVVHPTPIGLVIEIETRGSGQEGDPPVSAAGVASPERRRFELHFEYEDRSAGGRKCLGFRLVELGADPRLGAIFFTREKSS